MKFVRNTNESDEDLIYRICEEKSIIGTWNAVANILNEILESEYDESTYRKRYAKLKDNKSKDLLPNNVSGLTDMKRELEKEKIKFRDERNEYNRKIREEARKESFLEMVQRIIGTVEPFHDPFILKATYEAKTSDLILHLSDLHGGMNIKSSLNQFDMNILQQRLQTYLNKVAEVKNKHQADKCYLIIGEIISGLIHDTLRIENNENVIQQFVIVSDLISNFIKELSKIFAEIHIYVTPGNHSRVVAQKDKSLKGENFDALLPYFLKAKFEFFPNVKIHSNKLDIEIASFKVRGFKVMSSHGDKDSVSNVVQNFSMLTGEIPDLVYLGHRHTNGLTTIFNTKVIESGCFSGIDNFAMSKRLFTYPESTISVVTDNGFDCLYDVTLK